MSLTNTLFVGLQPDGQPRLPFDRLIEGHVLLRDAIAVHSVSDPGTELWPFIALTSFTYAFNAYKALGLILPHLYHESGSVLLRQIWEASLNLHWIEREPQIRSQDFCNFTVMETRKIMKKTDPTSSVDLFDEATKRFQSRFHYSDRHGKDRLHSSFTGSTVAQRAEELGDPWKSDYNIIYHLASMHAHGAPCAILHSHFVQASAAPEARERDSTALIAYLSMRVLVADFELLVRNGVLIDSKTVHAIFTGVLNADERDTEQTTNGNNV